MAGCLVGPALHRPGTGAGAVGTTGAVMKQIVQLLRIAQYT